MKNMMRAAIAAILLIGSSCSFAMETGRFDSVEGRVDLLRPGQSKAVAVTAGEAVKSGDIIRTKSSSKCEIKFDDDTVLRLAENTRVEIKQFALWPHPNNKNIKERLSAEIHLERGNIRTVIKKVAGRNNFRITTPNSMGTAKGTDLFVAYQKSATAILVVEGNFSVANLATPKKTVDITSGRSTFIVMNEPPQAPRTYLALEKERSDAETKPSMQKALAQDDGKRSSGAAEGYSEPGAITATVVKTSGDVRIRSRNQITWHDAKAGEILSAGDTISTRANGKIEIKLDNGNIINLQPNTELILQKLTQDQQSGDYENLLEATKGKLRAKVGKMKGNSRFEIKTPTAVAAVRGTIMFLDILPNLTSAYFEEGDGVLTSIISGVSKIVEAGNTSNADANGGVSNPTGVSNQERSNWHSGWDTGGGAEGYSPPERYTGEGGTDKGDMAPPESYSYLPFDKVPVTDTSGLGTTGGGGGGATTPTIQTIKLNAMIGGAFGFDDAEQGENNNINAALSSDLTSAPWSGTAPASIAGTYVKPDYDSHIWQADIAGTGDDGGGFLGWTGGTWHSWEGVTSSIYIDSTGMAGNIFGYLSGTNTSIYEGDGIISGTFGGNGDLFIIPMAQSTGATELIDSGSASGDLYVSFDNGNGYFNGQFFRAMKGLPNQNWGIWKDLCQANYHNENKSETWIGVAGGRYFSDRESKGYFLTTYEGIDRLETEGSLRTDVTGMYLDSNVLGAYYGTFLGSGEEDGDDYYVEAIGLGGYTQELLAYNGYYNTADYEDGGFGYYNLEINNVDFGEGYIEGRFGGTHLVGPNTAPVVFLGEYDNPNGRKLWAADFYGIEKDPSAGATYIGTFAGIDNNGSLEGWLETFYIRPAGDGYRIGYISSSNEDGNFDFIRGNFHQRIGMLQAQGYLTPYIDELTNYTPEDLLNGYYDNSILRVSNFNGIIQGDLSGTLAGESFEIKGEEEYEHNWGLFRVAAGGTFSPDSPPSGDWKSVMGGIDRDSDGEYTSYWIGLIKGTSWEDNRLTAVIDGINLVRDVFGNISGNMIGVYDDNTSYWESVSMGTYIDTPLALSGTFGDGNPTLYYFDGRLMHQGGYQQGLIGATTPEWWNSASFPFIAMGEYADFAQEGPYVWQAPIESQSVRLNGSELINGSFIGYSVGLWGSQKLEKGRLVALYLSPVDYEICNAGTFKGVMEDDMEDSCAGEFANKYYPEQGLWVAEGYCVPVERAQNIEADIQDLPSLLEYNYCEGAGLGNKGQEDLMFAAVSGTEVQIRDQNWGIWQIQAIGNAANNNNAPWRIALGGNVYDSEGGNLSYLLGTMSGDSWSNGQIESAFRGIVIMPNEYGFGVAVSTGDIVGTYDTDVEVDTTWQAAGVGEWVTLAELVSGPEGVGFDQAALAQMVSVPITETYTALLDNVTGSFNGTGSISGAMDISFYADASNALSGIWAALFNGTYSNPSLETTGTFTFSDATDATNATLTNLQWNALEGGGGGTWLADVNGTAPETTFAGQAGGTFTGAETGEFAGAGAGTWERAQ